MRKQHVIFLICLCFLSFISCEKKDETNPLVGTMWVYNHSGSYAYDDYLEFTDATHVIHWNTNNSIRGEGTYSISGNQVTFIGFSFLMSSVSSTKYIYKTASFTNNSITVYYDLDDMSLGYDKTKVYIKK